MQELKERVKRHAQKVAHAGRHVHKHLQTRVHPVVSWWAVSISALSAVLILNGGLAQLARGDTSTPTQLLPVAGDSGQQMPLQQFQPGTAQPLQPGQPCNSSGGSQCPPPPNNSGQPGSPNSFPNNFNGEQPGQNGSNFQPPMPCNSASGTPCAQPQQWQNQNGGQNSHSNFGGPNQEQQMGQQPPQVGDQQFQMMKRNLSQMVRQISRTKSEVKSLQKQSVTIPDDVAQALATLDSSVNTIKNAQSGDDVQSVMDEMQDAMQTLQEQLPKLHMAAQLPKMFKQAQKLLDQANKAYTSYQKKAATAKLDLTQALTNFKLAIDQQQATLDQIKATAQTDPQAAMEALQNDFFGNMDDLQNKRQVLDIAVSVRQGINMAAKQIAQVQKQIKILQKKGLDTSDLEQQLSEAQTQVQQVKNLIAAQTMDTDAVMSAVEDLMSTKQVIDNDMQQLTGQNGFAPQMPQAQSFNFQPPQGFMMGDSPQGFSGPGQMGFPGQGPNQGGQ